jgi:Ca2+-binding EF-hand superfamily protein
VRPFAALLLCALAAPVLAAEPDIVFTHGADPLRLRLDLGADEKLATLTWKLAFNNFFNYFDRDNDGFWSAAEAGRVFAIPLPGGKELPLNFAAADENTDGKLSPLEAETYYRKNGFAPVTIVVQTAPAETFALGDALFKHLDRDGDGKLSPAELRQAVSLPKRLDENEDEVLTAAELLGAAHMPGSPKPAGVKPLPPDSAPHAGLKLLRDSKPMLATESKRIHLSADGSRLHFPGGACSLGFDHSNPTGGYTAAREFYLAQFKAAAGARPATKQLFEDDPTAQVLAGMFDTADRNGDGKLTRAEIENFLDLIGSLIACRIIVTVTDRGRNLFDAFDTGGDGRLDLDELTRAAKTLPEGLARDNPLERRAVPASYQLTVSRGPVGDSFGPVPFGATLKPKPPAAPAARGPAWFRAMDRNGDGFVSPQEFVGSPELFAKYDANKDGRISLQEAEAVKP